MREDLLDELLNVTAVKRYVNLYFRDSGQKGNHAVETIVSRIQQTVKNDYCFDIDVQLFGECKREEQEGRIVLNLINKELSQKHFKETIPEAISIADALVKLNEQLDRPAIAVFHFFQDIYSEKEKDILRSIRTFKGIEEKSVYLGILIISNRRIKTWELFPESNLDERHVSFFEYK